MRAGHWSILTLLGLGGAAVALGFAPQDAKKTSETTPDPALKRTREEVQKLDVLYKNAVVAITQLYDDDPPAINVAMKIFTAMDEKGYHKAKLVDASGAPKNEANLPKTPFEKRAAEAMQDGKPYYEEVVGQGNNRRLLAATIVPAVLEDCAKCHGAKEGDLLGFIRYDLPIQ
ncbi:MAG TPA: DUF3365 domain-containing protein [Isosphaeraceae bacterium]|nr:DUF3365 domain-containing protein [Isosphaeraceae bacterium]